MGFFFFLVYLVASFIRPAELSAGIAAYRPMQWIGWVAVLAALFDFLLGNRPNLKLPQLHLAWGFLFWAIFSSYITSYWLGGALGVFEALGTTLFLLLLVVLTVTSFPRFRTTAAVLTVAGAYLAGQGILAYHTGYRADQLLIHEHSSEDSGEAPPLPSDELEESPAGSRAPVTRIRGLGILADPNDLAQALVAILCFAITLRRPRRPVTNLIRTWIPVGLMLYGIFLTRSRGGIVALLAAGFLGLRARLGRVGSLTLAVAGGTALLGLGVLSGRETGMDESAENRINAWSDGLLMLRSSPIWGVGFGNFTEGADLVAHNSFLHCAAELGLVGYFLWLAVLTVTLVQSLILEKQLDTDDPRHHELGRWARATRLALISFLVAAFFLSRAYNAVLFLLVGLSCAIVDVARREGVSVPPVHLLSWITRILGLEIGSLGIVYAAVRILR